MQNVLTDKNSYVRYLPFVLLILVAYWMTRHNPYFWDTIQFGSEHAHWYYEHKFSYWLLPEAYDSGHPPVFGMYVALWWIVLGKTLAVSHLSMLPFTFLSLYLVFRISDRLVGATYSPLLALLCVADPVIASQHVLVSPDVIIFCGMLLIYDGVLEKRKGMISFGVLIMASISMRGMMVASAFGMYQMVSYFYEEGGFRNFSFQRSVRIFLPYLPGLLFFGFFMWYHYKECGWIGYHENSPWADSFEKVDGRGFLRNVLVAGFRFAEFGRAGLMLVLVILLWKQRQNWRMFVPLFWITGLLLFCLVFPQLFYIELLNIRYLLPVFFICHVLFVKVLFGNQEQVSSKTFVLYGIVVGILCSGNFWRYPKHIAMGWDATLSHVFYFKPRQQMLDYIAQQGIPYERVGTVFPEYGPFENIDLKGDQRSMQPLNVPGQEYVYYASVMNLSDVVLTILDEQYIEEHAYSNAGVRVVLYRKK